MAQTSSRCLATTSVSMRYRHGTATRRSFALAVTTPPWASTACSTITGQKQRRKQQKPWKRQQQCTRRSLGAAPTFIRSTQHPRPLTIRERARACALPDWVELRGSLASQAKQVGNLVRTNERMNFWTKNVVSVCFLSFFCLTEFAPTKFHIKSH